MNFQNFIFLKFDFSEQRRHGMEVYSSLDLVKNQLCLFQLKIIQSSTFKT
jgi:hypothetical protein